ncbi:hypothetical protein C0J45_4426, partial [Silurus meridionalis]
LIPHVEQLLNQRQRQRCLTWTKDKKDWTVTQWDKVVFSDERKFNISCGNQGPRHRRPAGSSRALHVPSADQLYGDADFIFQQDLAPAHTAKA